MAKKTALILTSALTNGNFSHISWKSFNGEEASLQTASHLALHDTKSPWAQSLGKAIHDKTDTKLPKPVLLHDDRIVGATYHHGTDHAHYIIGPLTSILRVSAQSENEREVAIQFARQQTTLGYVCYAIAQGHSKSNVTRIAQFEGSHRLDFLGVVIVKPTLYPNTLHRLSVISNEYSSVHYAATGDEYYASAIAVQSHLMAPTQEIILADAHLPQQKSAVLLLPKHGYEQYVKSGSFDHVFASQLL